MDNWEVAGKKNKSKSVVANGYGKDIDKKKIITDKSIETNKTMYEGFNDKQNKIDNAKKMGLLEKEKEPSIKKASKIDSKKTFSTPQAFPKTLREALTKISCTELTQVYENVTDIFPNNPIIWLKDIASYLSKKLEVPQITSITYSEFPDGFPYSEFPCKQKLSNIAQNCKHEDLELFLNTFYSMIINESNKENVMHGYKLLVQAIIFYRPEIIMNNKLKIIGLIKANQNKPQICLSIFWTICQIDASHLLPAFQVWIEMMLPFINCPNLVKYIIKYGEDILNQPQINLTKLYGSINYKQFFDIFDSVFLAPSHLKEEYRRRFLALYPKIKEIAMNQSTKREMKSYLTCSLSRLTENNAQRVAYDDKGQTIFLRNELAEYMITCFTLDKNCMATWETLHPKFLQQSNLFLRYLNENWSRVKAYKHLDTNAMIKTVKVLNKNDKFSPNKNSGYKDSIKLCRSITKKKSFGFWKMFILISILSILIGLSILYYDVNRSDPENSIVLKLNRKIDEYGYRHQVDRLDNYIDMGIKNAKKKFEIGKIYYFKYWDPEIQKYVKKVSKVTSKYTDHYYKAASPHVQKTLKTISEYYEKYYPIIYSHAEKTAETILKYSKEVAVASAPYLETLKIVVEKYLINLQNLAIYLYEFFQSYVANIDLTYYQNHIQDMYNRFRQYINLLMGVKN
ncbi:unnamed protein product [Gordionus sp. m RMFG-2023]|uniref:transmembrane protein 214-like n=1 Tax=Gordionus sp. m RMFG-2023 TaxID=3053472 RepID=UPI0030DDE238